jgi:HEPN domain-containing protein
MAHLNRNDLQQLAKIRIEEAALLLAGGKWDGAYYLAGYAVECALKACIARLNNQYDFPDKDFVRNCYIHNLKDLLEYVGLTAQMNADPARQAQWGLVRDWKEDSRYQRKSEQQAKDLYNAITDPTSGVLPWIEQCW